MYEAFRTDPSRSLAIYTWRNYLVRVYEATWYFIFFVHQHQVQNSFSSFFFSR